MPKQEININNVTITPNEQLRVASFNMMNTPYEHQTRLDMLVDAVNHIQPDVLSLQEINVQQQPDIIETLKTKTNLKNVGKIQPLTNNHGDVQVNTTLTNIANTVNEEISLHLPQQSRNPYVNALHSTFTFNHKNIHIYNLHLAWGSDNEYKRYLQIQKILHHIKPLQFKDPNAIFILTGDLNSVPESLTIRNLKGLHPLNNEDGTYWTDASTTLNNTETTTNAHGLLGLKTAAGVGIHQPSLNIERQIDYIMVKGYAHGRPGTPITYKKWATETTQYDLSISDHHGILTDLYIPEN